MYNLIKFYKDKITTYVYNDSDIDWVETNINELNAPLSDYFNHLVEFSEDLSVKDFVFLLEKYKDELDKHFTAYNHDLNFDIYLNEIRKEPEPDFFNECDEVEIVWETEVQKESGVNFIMDWVTFVGRIKNFKPQHQLDVPTRGLHMSPLRNWKNLPLKLNKMIFYSPSPFESRKSILKGIKHFSLFNVLSGFIYELTLHGTPEQQIRNTNDIKEQIKKAAEEFLDAQVYFIPLEAGLIPPMYFEEPQESVEELVKKMEKFVEEEEFEKAQEIKNKINIISKK